MSDRQLLRARASETDLSIDGGRRRLAPTHREREKGLWNFLTWSFFLAYALAAQQFVGSAAQAAEGGETAADTAEHAAAQDSGSPPPLSIADRLHAAEEAPAAVAGSTTPLDPTAVPAQLGKIADSHGFPDHIVSASSAGLPQHTLDGGALLGHGTELDTAAQGSTIAGESTAHLLTDAGDGVFGIVQGVVDPVLGLLPPSVDTLLQSVATGIDQVTTPLLTTVADTLQTVGSIVGPLAPGVDSLLQSVVTGVDQATSPLLTTVADTIQTLDSVVAPLADPVATVLQPLEPVGQLITTLTDGDATHDVVASAGSVVFAAAPATSSLGIDDLFTGGRYTDYGMALGTTPANAGATSPIGATAAANDMIDHLLAGTHDGGSADDSHHDGQVANVTVPSALDDLHLRGLGDGIV